MSVNSYCHCGVIPTYMTDLLVKHYSSQSMHSAFYSDESSSELELQLSSNKTVELMDRPEKHSGQCSNNSRKEVWSLKKSDEPVLITSDSNFHSGDEVSRICFENMHKVDVFLEQQFGRHLGSKKKAMVSYIHDSSSFNQVHWNPILERVYFGEVDENLFHPFVSNLDFTAHEFAHGVLQYYSDLPYFEQSGALNESLADIYTVMLKHFQQNKDANAPDANWYFGDGILIGAASGTAIRSMSNPGEAFQGHPKLQDDPQVSHMQDYCKMEKDRGGIHYNSGIPNKAFYLAATGIGGKVWEKTGKIWDLAMTQTKGDNFSTFALRTMEAVDTLQFGGDVKNAVGKAWMEVGVDLNSLGTTRLTRTPSTQSMQGAFHLNKPVEYPLGLCDYVGFFLRRLGL